MINWAQYTLLAQLTGAVLGVAVAYAINWFYERNQRIKEKKEIDEYAEYLKKKYK